MLTSRKAREEAGLFVADGTKLLQEAIRWWPGLDTVILSQDVEMEIPEDVRTVIVPKDVMESISPMQTPQGALFLCRLPEKTPFSPKPGMLLLDGIQDPGNLGTILRTADALEIPVALLEGCADPYGHKVVRASMGAVFRTPVVQTTWEQAKAACAKAGIPGELSKRGCEVTVVPSLMPAGRILEMKPDGVLLSNVSIKSPGALAAIQSTGYSETACLMFFFAGFALVAAALFGLAARRYPLQDHYRN